MNAVTQPDAQKNTATLSVAAKMVEAAGRLFHPFRGGPDYAFIPLPGCGACYPFPDPSAGPPVARIGRSMSLYRAGLRLALFLPLGVAMPLFRRLQGSPM
jgi:hypothetical protein